MYSERFNAIFVHIPKTAGQSIEKVFLARQGLSWKDRAALLMRSNDDPARGPARLAHLYAREYVECGHVSPSQFSDAYRFAVVRNPFDRFVSLYTYRATKWRMPFDDLVATLSRDTADTDEFGRLIAPQAKFIEGADGTPLVDTILRFETLEEDFRSVSRRLFGEEIALPHRNRSRRSVARPQIGEAARQRIFEYYQADFERFGYPSALPEPR